MSEPVSKSIPASPFRLERLTPVLIVDRIEPCLGFWERLGFRRTTEVPDAEGRLVFAIVERDGIEVMYQTRASVIADCTQSVAELDGHSVALFVVVSSLDEVERVLENAPVIKPRHDTFYDSTEIYVKEPGGNTVGFAQMRRKS